MTHAGLLLRRWPSAPRRAAPLLAALLAGCRKSVLDPQGPVGLQEKTILVNSLVVMMAIVIPTLVAALGFAWWFRASNTKAIYRPAFDYSGRIELVVWSIPILTITFLGGLIIIGAYTLDPARPLASKTPPLEVQVVALDWKWLFIYPEQHVASVNHLVIPAGRPVHFSLTSASVMNAFFVPQLGSQIYAMNGMVTQLNLQADHPGQYFGESSHFSGDGFSNMSFQVDAVPADRFAAWTAAQAGSPPLDGPAYSHLSQQGVVAKPVTFRLAETDLFDAVARQRIAPGPGPVMVMGGSNKSPGGGQ
jgi:cytochrome o ubiquinol oxidase subunit 2